MDLSAPDTAPILLWTLMRAAALAVLATEAVFLWTRRRETEPITAGQAAARLFWAATPAILLAGLAVWCLSSITASAQSQGVAQLIVPR